MKYAIIAFLLCFAACSREPAPVAPPAPAPAVAQPVRIPVAEFSTPVIDNRTIINKDGTVYVAPGQPVTVEREYATESSGPVVNQKESASGKGSSIDARGEKVDASLKSDAPNARLGASGIDAEGNTTSEGGASAGAAFSGTFKVLGQTPRQWMTYAVAVVCIITGGVFCYFGAYKMGVGAILLGVLLFAMGVVAETYPIVYVIIVVTAVLALVVLAVYAILTLKKKNEQSFALNRVVDGVDTHVETTGDTSLLATIKNEAQDAFGNTKKFDAIIDEHKKALGLLNKVSKDPLAQARAENAKLRAKLAETVAPTITTTGG